MFDLDALQSAKNKTKSRLIDKESNFEEEYEKGLCLLKDFFNDPDQETLNLSTEHFFNALQLKRSKVEVYFFISLIFHLLGNKLLATEYLEYAQQVDESFPWLEDLNGFILSM